MATTPLKELGGGNYGGTINFPYTFFTVFPPSTYYLTPPKCSKKLALTCTSSFCAVLCTPASNWRLKLSMFLVAMRPAIEVTPLSMRASSLEGEEAAWKEPEREPERALGMREWAGLCWSFESEMSKKLCPWLLAMPFRN